MKKTNLFLALAALAATADASALTRSFDGTGQAVLLPYYHAADGETTLFSVTNHAEEPKAVHVVIAEGRNGRPALTFNVYLAPRDSWSGALVAAAAGNPPMLVSNDDTCTSPAIPPQGVALRTVAFSNSNDDQLGHDAERLQQGAVELIETGVLTGQAATLAALRDCNALNARFANGIWRTMPQFEIATPSGGLRGDAQIIDVGGGVAWTTEPVVLDGFSHTPRHDAPGDYSEVRIFRPTSDGVFTVGERATIDSQHGADAVSLLLMSSEVEGGFLLGESLDASTRWVLSFPTRPAYVDNRAGGELPAGSAPQPPFGAGLGGAVHCVETDWQVVDGRGDLEDVQTLPMCDHVNVVDLGEELDTTVDTGRVRLGLNGDDHELNYGLFDGTEVEIWQSHGLPVLVQSLTEVRNANAQPGLLASYAITHRILRTRDDHGGF